MNSHIRPIEMICTAAKPSQNINTGHLETVNQMEENIIKELNDIVKHYILINFYKGDVGLENFLKSLERKVLADTMMITNGNQKKASQILGLKPTTLNGKLKKYKIAKPTENQLSRNLWKKVLLSYDS